MRHIFINSIFFASLIIVFWGCQPENFPPVAQFTVSPHQGDSLTVFYFNARETSDEESPTFGILLRWDFDGDSVFDTDYLKDKEYVRRFHEPGWHRILLEAKDVDGLLSYAMDSIYIFEGNGFIDSLTDPRDGQVYSIARINYQWIMTENLRYGTRLDSGQLPADNGIPEFYNYLYSLDYKEYGGLYNWDEAMNYNKNITSGICPPGWHVPTKAEWTQVLSIFPSISANMLFYWGKEAPTGFNLEFQGFMYYTVPPDSSQLWYPLNTVAWWTSDKPSPYLQDPDLFINSIRFFYSSWEFRRHIYRFDDYRDERTLLKYACYLRCFKDPE